MENLLLLETELDLERLQLLLYLFQKKLESKKFLNKTKKELSQSLHQQENWLDKQKVNLGY